MSNYGLSSKTKKSVKSTVLALRNLLEGEFDPDTGDPIPPGGDVARQIARYGILVNKPESLKSENAPEYLTDEEKKKRERISAAIKREVAIFGEPSDKTALRRGMRAFIRQSSYTWVNRLLGLRCMEARGLLKDARGELDFVVTPSDDYGGLPRRAWRIKGRDPGRWQTAKLYDLQCEAINDACRQLTQEIKVLFDPEHDYGLIWPSPPALNILLQKIQELDKIATPSPFISPDFLGWVYQYFQTIEKEVVFEAASKKKKKIEKDDIIPATQIYTEHYMVEYLVQNTLGRFWMEMHLDSKLSTKWAYYVKPPEENPPVERELKKAIDIKLMDPAVGSGHFHLVAFDLLLDMYEEEIENAGQPGWPDTPSAEDKKDIPAAILEHNLFGIDIDARSIQLASLVLVMKARESGYEGSINHLSLVVANSAPFESEAWYQFIQNLEKEGKHSIARVLAALGLQLKNLDEFGSLLRIEDEMQKIIQGERKQWIAQAKMGPEQDYLFPEMIKPKQKKIPFETTITDETFFDRLGAVIEKELNTFYLKAREEGLAEEAIIATDAERGFDFLQLCIQRYDAVYTNPPYMGSKNMGDRLKKFVASAYPQGKRDLFASFILRCIELSEENAFVGMVTQQSWMFLKSFNSLRAVKDDKNIKSYSVIPHGLLRDTSIDTLVHLGPGAFSELGGEVVKVALFTARSRICESEHILLAFRLVAPKIPDEKARILLETISSPSSPPFYQSRQRDFFSIPEAPIVYWVRPRFLELLQAQTRLGDFVDIREGLGTRWDERFLRNHWEINSIGDVKNDKAVSGRWFWCAKGGGYKKWVGLELFLVDWENDGYRIKNFIDPVTGKILSRPQNTQYFFRNGLTYSMMAQGSISVRTFKDSIFNDSAPSLFLKRKSNIPLFGILSFLNSRAISYLLRTTTQALSFRPGYASNLPWPTPSLLRFKFLGEECANLKKWLISRNPIERRFSACLENSTNASSLTDAFFEVEEKIEALCAVLHTLEGIIDEMVFSVYELDDMDIQSIFDETGVPPAFHPVVHNHDTLPDIQNQLSSSSKELLEKHLKTHECTALSSEKLEGLKQGLRSLYISGPGVKVEINCVEPDGTKEKGNAEESMGAYIPIPTETFVEEFAQNLKVHPISIYWLLREIREKEKIACPSELKRYAEDYVTVIILCMLGYQWPKQVEAGESIPDWTDRDGIIPLTDGLGEPTLLDRIRNRFGADFGEEKEASIESEFANIVGKPLERSLEEDFFARHVKQFKNRPVAWHIVSDPSVVNHETGQSGKGKRNGGKKKHKPAFSVMIHYHRFVDGDKGYGKLLLLKNKYLEKLMSQTRSKLESLRGRGDDPKTFDRIAELDRKLVELDHFRERLERIQEGKDLESSIFVRWKSTEEQPQGWRPDINDGVKINIAPWERLGMFPVKKIVGEVEMVPD